MFGKMIWLSEFLVNDLRCEELILLQFYLQMLNDNIKTTWNLFKIQISVGLKAIFPQKNF